MTEQRIRTRLLVSLLAALAPSSVAWAQASPGRPDSASQFNEAERLSWRAGATARGSPSERRAGVRLLQQAIPLYAKAGARRDVGIAYYRIMLLFGTEQPDSALVYGRQALGIAQALADRVGEAATRDPMATAFVAAYQSDSAVAYWKRILVLARAEKNRSREATTLGNLGGVLAAEEPDSALFYLRQALPLQRALANRQSEGLARFNMGVAFLSMVRLDSALNAFRQALAIQASGGDQVGSARSLHAVAAAYAGKHQPDSALSYLQRALSMRRELGDRTGEAQSLDAIGASFSALAQPESAFAYHRRALTLERNMGLRGDEATTLNSIGLFYHAKRQSDSALAYLRQALAIEQAIGDRNGVAITLGALAEVYRSLGRLDSTLTLLDASMAVYSQFSRRTGTESNRLSFNEATKQLYDVWSLTWLALPGFDRSVDSSVSRYGALAVAERGRAQALLDLMRGPTTPFMPGTDLPAEGARLAAGIRSSGSNGLIYQSTDDTLIIWLITRDGIITERRAIRRDSLAELVRSFRDGLGVATAMGLRGAALENHQGPARPNSPRPAWQSSAGALTAILLPTEILRNLGSAKDIVIVPQGVVALVPFAALPIGPAGEPFGAGIAVRYAPSLATLSQTEARAGAASRSARADSLPTALVVGNPQMPGVTTANGSRDRLGPLPRAEAESRSIAKQLGTESLNGADASETEVLRRLPSAPLVHLATHGFAYSSESGARSSFVALAPGGGNDGLLTVGQILDDPELKLIADLVVLSACETGLGDLQQAEGTIGLQRAFLAKGARSVLVSLWSVSDAATQSLMTAFYRHWRNDLDHPSKAEALRRSQNEIRGTPGWEHPRYWAAFQLVGAN